MTHHRSRTAWSRRTLAALGATLALAGGSVAASPAQAAADIPGDPALAQSEYPEYVSQPAEAQEVHASVTTTSVPCDANGGDESHTRTEILKRARDWFNSGPIPYSQSRCFRNQYGDYRTDCSGFVAMAWGLGGRGSDFWTGNLDDRSTVIPRSDLKPGDALLRHTGNPSQNHVALFVEWSDDAHTKPYVYEQRGSVGTSQGTWSAGKAANYTPVRYDNLKVPPSAPLPPHGPLWDRGSSAAGDWDTNATPADTNPAAVATAATVLPNGAMHAFVVIPGSGVWDRVRNSNGVWDANATRIDTNPRVTDVAAAAMPDGSLHLQVLVPGSGIWNRKRGTDSHFEDNATQIDTNGGVTDIASAALPDGTLHVQGLVPGSGVWDRARRTDSSWDEHATRVDTNGGITDISSAGLPDGTLHLQGVVPGSGIWDRARGTDGSWENNASHIDTNGAVIAVAAAATPDGTLHIDGVLPGSGMWHRTRSRGGDWAAHADHVDFNGAIFDNYTAAFPNGTVHIGGLVNVN